MKNIAFWYEVRIRNDGPPLYLKTAAERNKKEFGLDRVDHWIPINDPRRYGKYDLNIWVDFGDDALMEKYDLKYNKIGSPSAYWVSDSHVGLDYRLDKAKEFDYVFVAISDHVDKFKKAVGHDRVYWLPHAAEPTAYDRDYVLLYHLLLREKTYKGKDYAYWLAHPKELSESMNIVPLQKYDVCFIGHLNCEKRIVTLDKYFRQFPNFFYGSGLFFEKAATKYVESKIVFNISIGNEANMRAFETPLSGALLVTDRVKDLEKLGYKDGENVCFYNNNEEMIEKTKYYLEHEEERKKVAEAGRKLVLENHTYKHRMKKLLDTISIK